MRSEMNAARGTVVLSAAPPPACQSRYVSASLPRAAAARLLSDRSGFGLFRTRTRGVGGGPSALSHFVLNPRIAPWHGCSIFEAPPDVQLRKSCPTSSVV